MKINSFDNLLLFVVLETLRFAKVSALAFGRSSNWDLIASGKHFSQILKEMARNFSVDLSQVRGLKVRFLNNSEHEEDMTRRAKRLAFIHKNFGDLSLGEDVKIFPVRCRPQIPPNHALSSSSILIPEPAGENCKERETLLTCTQALTSALALN